jgi:hypothetical protein
MTGKKLIQFFLLLTFLVTEPLIAQEVVVSDTSIGYKKPTFYKKFLDFFKKKKKKLTAKQNSVKADIREVKATKKELDGLIKELSPVLGEDEKKAKIAKADATSFRLTEFSLHAIEESRFLALYDNRNHYRTEKQWGEFVGTEQSEEPLKMKREWGKKTLYGFHPFWMGLNYYQYNFEIYDRIAYYGYSVEPGTGRSATYYPAHSFKTSQIIKKAHERSGGKCKVDLCVNSYGLERNSQLFSGDWENKINALVNEVAQLVTATQANGICLDFQQVATGDSAKFTQMVRIFHEKFSGIAPGELEITMVLPAYSVHFPYTISAGNFLQLWKYVNRFIVMGYSSYAGLYTPAKDSLAAGITHDVLWNILLVDDGINHYSQLTHDVNEGPVSPERIIADKMLLSLPACEIKLLSRDSLQVVKYSDLKMFRMDKGFLPSFQEKTAYATAKNLNGLAIWGLGYDNGIGAKELQDVLAAYTYGEEKQDQALLKTMEKLISENKNLTADLGSFFPKVDSLSEESIPLPDVLKVDLPAAGSTLYKTVFERTETIIQHAVVLCLIIFLFFSVTGVVISLFFESVRETILTKEIALFLFALFSSIGIVVLLKKLLLINNVIFLFSLGILIGSIVPFLVRRRQRNAQREDRP